jgi:phosphoribosyl-ATP pyrophosphohydrolase/phosphoribosyl-AMP cyclohydrolase
MTDRTLAGSTDLDGLDFAKVGGLVPVVAQDADDGRVLMVAWATREALEKTLATGRAWFFSRSRNALWMKGETSGNVLEVVSLHADCDGDTVLARVHPAGPACHTGEATCFGEGAAPRAEAPTPAAEGPPPPADAPTPPAADPPASPHVLTELEAVLEARRTERPEGSYTVRLLEDENLRLKKLGEETAELVTALAKAEPDRIPEEAGDLIYHVLVALRGAGVELAEVWRVLEGRRG